MLLKTLRPNNLAIQSLASKSQTLMDSSALLLLLPQLCALVLDEFFVAESALLRPVPVEL